MGPAPKYQPVPTEQASYGSQHQYGTDDHTANYTVPPPAYSEPLLSPDGGVPRADGDSIPYDFDHKPSVSEFEVDIRHAFIRKVYAILTVQLAATAAFSTFSFYNVGFKTWVQLHPAMLWIGFIGSLVFLGLTWWKRRSYPINLAFLGGFTACEAYLVGMVTSTMDSSIVLQAALITGVVFFGLTVFTFQTKYDFQSWHGYLFAGLWLLIVSGFVAAFFPYNKTFDLVYAVVAALIFCAYIVVDTQWILQTCSVEDEVVAAMQLYLDVINLFLQLLRILQWLNDNNN